MDSPWHVAIVAYLCASIEPLIVYSPASRIYQQNPNLGFSENALMENLPVWLIIIFDFLFKLRFLDNFGAHPHFQTNLSQFKSLTPG